MKDAPHHEGFVFFSEAVTRLADGMWGGLRQAEPVRVIKAVAKKASIGFGPWREQAGKRLTTAARHGEVAVYLAADPRRSSEHLVAPQRVPETPVSLSTNVLSRMITSHGSLQDGPIRPSINTADGDEQLFQLLTVGVLLVRTSDFEAWHQSERDKGKWPS